MHLTHQTPSALLQAFGLVSCITNGEFIRFEKEKKQARGIPRKTTPNCQSQLKSVSLKSKTTHSSLTTKTMSTDTRFYKKISQPFSGNHTQSFPFLLALDFLPYENGFSYVGKWIFIHRKMDFHTWESKKRDSPAGESPLLRLLTFATVPSYCRMERRTRRNRSSSLAKPSP